MTACRVRRLLLPLAVATANTNEGRTTVRARAHMNAGGSTLLVHRGLLNAGGLALPRASSASSTRGGLLVFGMITVSITFAHGPVSNKATGAEYQAAMLPVRSAPTRTHPSQPPHELPRTRG